ERRQGAVEDADGDEQDDKGDDGYHEAELHHRPGLYPHHGQVRLPRRALRRSLLRLAPGWCPGLARGRLRGPGRGGRRRRAGGGRVAAGGREVRGGEGRDVGGGPGTPQGNAAAETGGGDGSGRDGVVGDAFSVLGSAIDAELKSPWSTSAGLAGTGVSTVGDSP